MYFATSNKGKILEAQRILGIEVEGLDLELDEVQTLDPVECAEKKALAAYIAHGELVLVEDTAFFIDAWNGLPGVFIDYFMKTIDTKGILKLLDGEKNRNATAQVTLAISFDGVEAKTFVGKVFGTVSPTERGSNGFGWDTIFVPEGRDRTFAEMEDKEKDSFSMRAKAFQNFHPGLPSVED